MRLFMRLALAALLTGAHVAAADRAPIGEAEFRAFAEGWTLHFESGGAPYGAESFLPGDRTLWLPEGGTCAPGAWRAEGAAICFDYGDAGACWRLWRDERGVAATSTPDGATEVRVVRRDRAPIRCGEDLLSLLAR